MSDIRRERRPIRVAGAVLLGLATLGAAIWGTAHSLGLAATEDADIWLPPTPKGGLTAIEQRFVRNQAVLPEDDAKLDRLAAQAPLAFQPFAYRGFAALQENDFARAEALLSEARDRRPRSRLSRLALLQIHATRGDLEPMIAELVPLMRLEPGMIEPLAAEWLKVLREPGEIELLAQILRDDPATYARVAEQAARAGLAPDLLAAFLEHDPRGTDAATTRTASIVLTALAEAGAYRQALASWRRSSGATPPPAGRLYNADFSDRDAPPPFNWDTMRDRNGVAEFHSGGGVHVDYFGRGAGTFLRQLTLLPPGRYRLSVDQRIGEPAGQGLAWTVSCAGSERVLLDRPVRPEGSGAARRADFVVSADCPAQWIALGGRGELREGEGQRLEIERAVIEPAGAAR